MNILVTNLCLTGSSGTETYVRDLALTLNQSPNINIEIFSPICGKQADFIRSHGINVVESLDKLTFVPNIIHAHHTQPTICAIKFFPNIPVIFFCHDRTSVHDIPVIHPQIVHYVTVSYSFRDRFFEHGISLENTSIIFNWVDTEKFFFKKINQKPKKALIFNNYVSEHTYLPCVRKACLSLGIDLDAVGANVGNCIDNPEQILGDYDIVFAKGKAAIEAIASGAATVLCDFIGIGELITPDNFYYIQKYNFGVKVPNRIFHWRVLAEEIKQYNPSHIKKLSNMIRKYNNMTQQINKIILLYERVLQNFSAMNLVSVEPVVQQPSHEVNYIKHDITIAPKLLETRINDEIALSSQKKLNQIKVWLIDGWSDIENWGVWTNQEKAIFMIASKELPENFTIALVYHGLVTQSYQKQNYEICNSNNEVLQYCDFNYEKGLSSKIVSVNINKAKDSIEGGCYIAIIIRMLNPTDMHANFDSRLLGMGLQQIKIIP